MSPIFECPSCGTPSRPDASFCSKCGANLSGGVGLTGNRWTRSPHDFATRVEVEDVQGFFKKGLIVEEGTRALFFTNGAYSGIVEAGKHEMGGLMQRINNVFSSKKTTAVLVDSGDVEISFELDGVQTSDPLRLAATCRVVLRIDESPVPFFANLMKGQQSYPLSALKQFLEIEVRDAVQEFVGGRSATDLSSNLSVKQAMEQVVAAHLARTLERKGLQLVQIRVLDLRHPRLVELTGKLEEYWLDAQELRTRQVGAAMRDGIERKVLDQETAHALMQVEVFEERAKVFQRLGNAAAAKKMEELTTAADLEDFIAANDKRHVLTADDVFVLTRAVQERNQDHALTRKHLLDSLEANQQAEVERLKLIGRLSLQSTVADAMRSEELNQFEVGLEKQRRATAVARTGRLDDARTAAEIEELERIQDEKALKMSLAALRDMKGIQGDEADRDQRRNLDAERDRHARELERFRQLAELGPDALLSFGPADRAAMLADLRKTEMLKGMTEEQILAMQAGSSAHIAEAFKERFKSDAARGALDQLLQEKDKHYQQTVELMREQSGHFKGFAERALDTMRDTAVAATRAGQPGMTVVTPGMGAGVVQTGVSGTYGRVTVCPVCRRDVPAGQNFCENCGHKFVG